MSIFVHSKIVTNGVDDVNDDVQDVADDADAPDVGGVADLIVVDDFRCHELWRAEQHLQTNHLCVDVITTCETLYTSTKNNIMERCVCTVECANNLSCF